MVKIYKMQDASLKTEDLEKKILRDVSRTGAVVRISLPSPWGRGNENRPSGYPGQVGAPKKLKKNATQKREWHKVCHKQKNPSSAYTVFRLKLCTLQGLRCVILPDRVEKATSEAMYVPPKTRPAHLLIRGLLLPSAPRGGRRLSGLRSDAGSSPRVMREDCGAHEAIKGGLAPV